MTTRRGFLGMLGGAAAAAIAAPVLAKLAPTPTLQFDLMDEVLDKYMRPAMLAIAESIERDLLEFHGVTRFNTLEPYGNLHTVEVYAPLRRFDDPCSTDVRFSVQSLAL